jgi:putative hydrolase of HD superfamily
MMNDFEQNDSESVVNLLVELQRLKRLDRTGWTLRGLPNGTESVAAHSFGVAVTVMLIADALSKRGISLNLERTLRMALVHDWSETRIGDMPRTAASYIGNDIRKRAEMAVFQDLVGSNGSASLYGLLYSEYENRESPEARLVKAADVIDLLVQVLALERAGARGLDEFWEVVSNDTIELEGEAKVIVSKIIDLLVAARPRPGT